jgi:hypothetical protein
MYQYIMHFCYETYATPPTDVGFIVLHSTGKQRSDIIIFPILLAIDTKSLLRILNLLYLENF